MKILISLIEHAGKQEPDIMALINQIPFYWRITAVAVVVLIAVTFMILLKMKIGKTYNFQKVSECIRALKDSREEIKVRSCWALAVHKSAEAERALLNSLMDQSKFVRGAAASAISSLRKESSIKELEEAINTETDDYTKSQMEKAVRRIMGEDTIKHDLAESLDEKDVVIVKPNPIFDRQPAGDEGKKGAKSLDIERLISMEKEHISNSVLPKETRKIISFEKDISSSEAMELNIEIRPDTDEARDILRKFQEINARSESFTVTVTFRVK
ncbi:MAG: HEAT repeat domain-containing protein [Candidatus Eremiobacterota bacterium]